MTSASRMTRKIDKETIDSAAVVDGTVDGTIRWPWDEVQIHW